MESTHLYAVLKKINSLLHDGSLLVTLVTVPLLCVVLQPPFPEELGDELGGELLMAWNFAHSFSDVLGLPVFSVDGLLAALVKGQGSRLLGLLHINIMRVLQADMEESWASGASQVRSGRQAGRQGGGECAQARKAAHDAA